MNARPTAVEVRLFQLFEQCQAFLQAPDARLLRWQVQEDELSMVQAFLAIEQGEDGELPAVFLRCDAPFRQPEPYTRELLEGMKEAWEAAGETFSREGLASFEALPSIDPRRPAQAWIEACHAFLSRLSPRAPAVVSVLQPQEVMDIKEFSMWVAQAVACASPAVRLIVVEPVARPWLDGLGDLTAPLAMSIRADLDMEGALSELARGAKDAAAPSGLFRRQFLALGQAAKAGNVPRARQAAEAALATAQEHGWPHLEVTVWCALAGVMSAAGQGEEALGCYSRAGKAAEGVQKADAPLGARLRLTAQLGAGAVLVGQGEVSRAALLYEGCAQLALEAADGGLRLESWRMAAYCHEAAGRRERSWQCGAEALDAAELLDEQARKHSTLPLVGEGLLRLASRGEYARFARQVEARMVALTGDADWRSRARVSGGQST